jgi:hypothetical protein
MERNYSFEAGYLINLTLLVLGALNLPVLKNHISLSVAYFFFSITAIHLVIFNLSYFFHNSVPYQIKRVETLQKISRATFGGVSASFVFIFFHVPFNYVFACESAFLTFIFHILIPGIITFLILFFIVKRELYEEILQYKDIGIEIQPQRISVYPSYEETQRIIMRITNNSTKKREFDISIDSPEGVKLRYQNREDNSLYIKEAVSEGKIPLDVDLKYEGDEEKSEFIHIKIKEGDMVEERKIIANCHT